MNNFGANPSDLSIYSNENRGKPKVSILHYSLFTIHSSLLGLAQSDKPKFEILSELLPHIYFLPTGIERENTMKILTIGDVVGRRAIEYLSKNLRKTASSLGADFVVCNGENASEIHGLALRAAEALLACGVALITLGNHAFGSRDLYGYLDDSTDLIIRPANYPAACPGVGYTVREVSGLRILCMNLSGTAFMDPLDNPFTVVDRILDREKGSYDMALLDFHGEATSEKLAMGYMLDGRVSAVWGTHTHVPTADAQVLPKGTGYVTDLGMTGPKHSVLGIRPELSIAKFRGDLTERYRWAEGPTKLEAVLFTIDSATGKCLKAERVDQWD